MAEGLPRYQGGEEVQVGPLQATADTYQQYTKMFGEIESATKPVADSFISQSIKDRAQVDGKNPGFQTVLPIGAGARLYNQIGLAQNKQYVTADIIDKIKQFKNEAMGYDKDGNPLPNSKGLTTESLENFNTALSGYATSLYQTVPSENRGYIKQYLSAHSTVAQTYLQNQWHKNQILDANIKGVDTWNTNVGYMVNANMSGDPVLQGIAKTMMSDSIKHTEAQASTYGFKQAERMISDTKKKYYNSHYMGLAQNYLDNNHPELVEELKDRLRNDSDAQTSLGFHGQNSLISSITSLQTQHLQQEGITKENFENIKSSLFSTVHQSQEPDPRELSNAQNYLLAHHKEGDWETLQNNLEFSKNIYGISNLSKTIPLSKLNQSLSQLTQIKTQLDPKDSNYKFQSGEVNNAIKATQNIINTRLNDKATAAMEYYGGYQQELQKEAENPQTYDPMGKYNHIINTQRAQNFDSGQFQIAPVNQVKNDISNYDNLSAGGKIQFWNNQADEYKKWLGVYINQFQHQSKMGGFLSLYTLSHDPETAQYAQGVATALNSTPANFDYKHDEETTSFGKMKDLVRQNLMQTGNILDIFHSQGIDTSQSGPLIQGVALYAAYRFSKNKDATVDGAIKNACNIMVNDHYTSGSMNGVNYAIPKTTLLNQPIDPRRAQAILKMKAESVVNGKDIYIPPGAITPTQNVSPEDAKRRYLDSLKMASHWKNIGNSGYQLVDHDGSPIMTFKTGIISPQPVKITYDEIADLKSDVNADLNAEVQHITASTHKALGSSLPPDLNPLDLFPGDDHSALSHIINRPTYDTGNFLKTKLNQVKTYFKNEPNRLLIRSSPLDPMQFLGGDKK